MNGIRRRKQVIRMIQSKTETNNKHSTNNKHNTNNAYKLMGCGTSKHADNVQRLCFSKPAVATVGGRQSLSTGLEATYAHSVVGVVHCKSKPSAGPKRNQGVRSLSMQCNPRW